MKKIVSIITVLLAVLFVQAQTITQNGVSYRYNGKNPRTPIGGVYIKPVTADNGVVSNASNGSFSVVLKNLKMGSRIGNVKVAKQGMMVFNQQAVDEWNVRKDPLCLILCDANEFQKQKKNLIAIGERQAKKKYDKKLAELKKRNEAQQLQIDDYYNKLDSLEKEYQNALKHMDEYADVFARIDESEIDTLAQRAIELFNKGEIDESIRLFEQGNYMKKLDDALHTKAQAQNLRNVADSAEALADKDIEEYVKSIKAQVSAYQVKNDYEKVGELLKGMADRLQTLEAIWNYIDFCSMQNRFKDEELYLQKYNTILEKSQRIDKPELLANLYDEFGSLYDATQRHSKSEEMFKSALAILEQLTKENPERYEPILASSRDKLGTLFIHMQRFLESLFMYRGALAIRERLAKKNPKLYGVPFAITYGNLSGVFYKTQNFKECETLNISAISILKRLAIDYPINYKPALAGAYQNLATLYLTQKRYKESEMTFKSALLILEDLVRINPEAYEPTLAKTNENLAKLYDDTQRFQESEPLYQSCVDIYLRMHKRGKRPYIKQLAASYYKLGTSKTNSLKYQEAISAFENSLKLAKKSGNQMDTLCTLNLTYLENLYAFEKKYERAYSYNEELLNKFRPLFGKNKKNLKDIFYRRLFKQSAYANILGKFKEGEKFSLEALQVDSTKHITYAYLAAALLFQGKIEEAEKIYRQYKSEFKDGFLGDFAEYERLQVIPKEYMADVERIKAMLQE